MVKANAYFVSDLHLFARRSQATAYLATMKQRARGAHTFVLGGDIFDFRWTTLASVDQTVNAAANWLRDLVESAPRCQFHMLLGNHDHHGCLIKRLQKLADEQENLSWDPYYLRLGDSIFLHGDAVDGDATHDGLVQLREGNPKHVKRGPTANMLYDTVVQTGVHRAAPVVAYPKRRTARRLLEYLEDVGHGAAAGARNVYFGHTHRPLHAYEYRGVRFHNGGAPIKGVPFRIVAAEAPG